MKRIFFISVYAFLTLFAQTCSAKSWPIFTPPDKTVLLTLNLIDTSRCPRGYGKLIAQPIPISEFLCKNFCPINWYWIVKSSDNCLDLSELNIKYLYINHYPKEGTINYSVITAVYGPLHSNQVAFKYSMVTVPGEYWYCVVLDKEKKLLSCANDI
jgi:hypothetical protein